MKLLLDTHIALWAVTGDPNLGTRAASLIRDPDNVVAVSLVSVWEIAIKNALGRSGGASIGVSSQEAGEAFVSASFALLGLTMHHVCQVEALPPVHRDPFDRLLVAQAQVDRLTFVTRDRTLAGYGDHVLVV